MADDQVNTDSLRAAPVLSEAEQVHKVNETSLFSEIEKEDQRSASPVEENTLRERRTQTQTPPSSPVESEEEEEEEETESHVGPWIPRAEGPGPHLESGTVASRHDLVLQYTQQFGLQALIWFQYIWTILSYLASTTRTIGKGVVRSLQSQIYVFFQDSSYPYRLQDYSTTGPGVSPVEWYYDADEKLFISSNLYNTTTEYTSHHFEWLSAQVKYNDLVLYDISDFIQQVKWASNLGPGDARAGTQKPSPARVLAAWSLDSGIVLNSVNGITLSTINEDGTESNLDL